MIKDKSMTNAKGHNDKKYDLEERTDRFGERIIEFAKNFLRTK